MKQKLSNLIDVRKIITLMFAGVFCYLAISGSLSAESVLSILTMVFGFYFARDVYNNSQEREKK